MMPTVTEKTLTLEKRMALLGVREEDIVESFIRSSGPGGQNVMPEAAFATFEPLFSPAYIDQ